MRVNSKLMYFGKQYVVLSIDPPYVSIKRVDADGEAISINFNELVRNPSFKAGKSMIKKINMENKEYKSILDTLPEKEREKVSRKFEVIKPILVLEKIKQGNFPSFYEFMEYHREYILDGEELLFLTQDKLIERIAIKQNLSSRTIKRHLSSFRKAANDAEMRGEDGLVSKAGTGHYYRSDNKQLQLCHPNDPDWVLEVINVRVDEEYVSILKEVLEKEYLTVKKKDKAAVVESIRMKCVLKNLEPLKAITLYKILERISDRTEQRMREGTKGAERFDSIERGFANNEALYPLHIVEIDHTPLDLDVLDDKSGLVIGRPWLTLGIDVYSRMIWCMYLSFEPPSGNRVRKAIQHGILFKHTKEYFNTSYEWDVFGIPDTIQLDNGTEFKNFEIKRLINETLKSNVRYRPRSTPRYGGTIERLFRTVNSKWIHQLDGTRKSNIFDLGEYDAEAEAALTLDNVREILTRYITDIYPFETHRGLPLDVDNPMSRYIQGLKKRGYPEFIEKEDEDLFKIELLPTLLKPYTRDGIRLNNVFYKSGGLAHLIDKREVKYKIKYDADDISKIYLQLPDSTQFIEVKAVNPSADVLEGINKYTYKRILEINRDKKRSNKIPGDTEVLKAKAELQGDIEKMYKKSRKTRQRTQRMEIEFDLKTPSNVTQIKKDPTYEDLFEAAKDIEERKERDG